MSRKNPARCPDRYLTARPRLSNICQTTETCDVPIRLSNYLKFDGGRCNVREERQFLHQEEIAQ